MTLVWLAAAWVAGLLLASRLDVAPTPLLLLAAASLPLAGALRVIRRSPLPALMVGLALLGFWRVEATAPPDVPLLAGESRQAALRGSIADDPEPGRRSVKFVLDVTGSDVGDGWQPASGKFLVYTQPPPEIVAERTPPYFHPGDFVEVQGTQLTPEPIDGFDYPAYLASHGISGVFFSRSATWFPLESSPGWRGPVFRLRTRLAAALDATLPAPHSSLAQALLLGWRAQIPPDVRDDFRDSGTSHLLAISGLHIGILLAIATGITGWALGWRRRVNWLVPVAVIWAYALVSGLPVSVVRAGLMGTLFLAAMALGRPHGALTGLALSAGIITAITPRALQQVSFQLSFTAMAGIIIALPWQARAAAAIRRIGSSHRGGLTAWLTHLALWLSSGLIVSLGATLATLPLVALYFRQVPLLGIPVTILALPSLPFVMAGSLLTALAGMVNPALGQVAAVTAWVPLSYLLLVVSGSPGPVVSGAWITPALIWAAYGAIALGLMLPRLRRLARTRLARFRSRRSGSWNLGAPLSLRPTGTTITLAGVVLLMAASAIVLLGQVWAGPDQRLHVHFFDVGQGDSALIVTPNGRQTLVDGGPDSESAARALSRVLPPWDRSLDLVVATHLDADHVGGLLAVLDRYEVGGALVGAPDTSAPLHPRWADGLDRSGVRAMPLAAGYRLQLDQGVELHVLNPALETLPAPSSDRNNNSVALRLDYGEISFLFTADIEEEAERRMLREGGAGLKSDVLKVGHHGSRTSSTPAFIQAVEPSLVVVSAGAGNRYGHPHPDVMARLEQAVGASGVYRTADHGAIHFVTDGANLWVETERSPDAAPAH